MTNLIVSTSPEESHKDDIMNLVFVDGVLFSGDYDGIVKKWDVSKSESIKEIQTWRAHNIGCPVYGMAYRNVSDAEAKKDIPDRLFTSSTEGQIREWDPETGENKNETIITNQANQSAIVRCLCTHEEKLYAGDFCGQLVCLGPDFKEIAKKFTYAEVWGLAISKDGLNAFNSRNNDTMVTDLTTVYLSTRYKETMAVKLSLNGRAPIVVTDHHVAMLDRSAYTVNIYQYDNQKFPSVSTTADGEHGGHEMVINAILLSEDGLHVVSSGWDGRVIMWETATGSKVTEYQCDVYINTLSWARQDGSHREVFVGGKDGYLARIQLA